MNNAWIEDIKLNQKTYLYLLILIFVSGFIIRIDLINFESAWIDEAYSIQLSTKSVHEIIIGCLNDQHPPLYYIFLKLWMAGSINVAKARLLSAFIGTITIIQTFLIEKELKINSWLFILFSCFYISVSPMHIWYSQEARMYIILLFFTLLSVQFSIKILSDLCSTKHKTSNFNWIIFIFVNILSLYTHYFSIFIILFELLNFIFVVRYKKINLKQANFGLFSFSAIGLGFVPWIPVLINQVLFHNLAWIPDTTVNILIISVNRLLFGPAVVLLPKYLNIILFSSLIFLFLFGLKKSFPLVKHNLFLFIIMISWITIPLLFMVIISISKPIIQFKQLIIILVPLIIIFTFQLINSFKKIGLLIVVGLLSLNAFSSYVQQINLTKDDWRGLTKFVEENFDYDGDAIFFNSSSAQLGFDLYKKEYLPTFGYPPDYEIINGGWQGTKLNITQEINNLELLKTNYKRIWYIQYYPGLWDPQNLIFNWFNNNMHVQMEKPFGSILMVLFN